MKSKILLSSIIGFILFLGCHTSKNVTVTDKSPIATEDTALFRLVQEKTFQYFWDGAEPISGLARERFHADDVYTVHNKNIITSGGGGSVAGNR